MKQISNAEIIERSKKDTFYFVDEYPNKVTTFQQIKKLHGEFEDFVAHEFYEGKPVDRKLSLNNTTKVYKSKMSGNYLFTVWFIKTGKVRFYAQEVI